MPSIPWPPELLDRAPTLTRDAELYAELARRNVERYVGTARVPVGLAGPLLVHGRHIDGEVFVPLATTEGTLVASVSRGCRVLAAAGGATARVTRVGGIQRAPVLFCEDIDTALELARNLEADWHWLEPVVAGTTRHGRLTDVRCFVHGRLCHVRLTLDPGDAAGQNMVSIAAAAVVQALHDRFPGIRRALMEGGFSGEKVPAPLNHLLGRGRAAVATAHIPADVLEQHTRARPEALVELLELYANVGGWCGYTNTHASLINILPALYIATGQDVASVPESCIAQNSFRLDPKTRTLECTVTIPNLVCGTVGGGTHLPTQRECLELMGCAGAGKVDRFAEIVAATALANELSFWGAIVADEWVAAHAKVRVRG